MDFLSDSDNDYTMTDGIFLQCDRNDQLSHNFYQVCIGIYEKVV